MKCLRGAATVSGDESPENHCPGRCQQKTSSQLAKRARGGGSIPPPGMEGATQAPKKDGKGERRMIREPGDLPVAST